MFTVEKGILEGCGFPVITMSGAGHVVKILPDAGFNFYYWTFNGGEILMEPEDIRRYGTTYGTPLLFPTPNRIRNGRYSWDGKTYEMKKRGETIVLHGLIKDEPFTVTRLEGGADCAVCEAQIAISRENDLYEGYPFECTFKARYTLDAQGMHLHVEIVNDDEKLLPFGFAAHPYFSKRGDAEKVSLTVPCKYYYEADETLIPSGRLLPAEGGEKIWDGLHTVESLYLDTVFRGMSMEKESLVRYEDVTIHISGSDCFRNAVVYTPHERPGFCIEPQTNATNGMNMHAEGLIDESGLLVLPAGKTFACDIHMTVTKN